MTFKEWLDLVEVKWTRDDHFKDKTLVWNDVRRGFISMDGYCKKILNMILDLAKKHKQGDKFTYGKDPLDGMPSATLISTDEIGLIGPDVKKKKDYEKDPISGRMKPRKREMGVSLKQVNTYIFHPQDADVAGRGGRGDEDYQGNVKLSVDMDNKIDTAELYDTIAHEMYHAIDDWQSYNWNAYDEEMPYRDKWYEKPAWSVGSAAYITRLKRKDNGEPIDTRLSAAANWADDEVKSDPKERRRMYRDLARMTGQRDYQPDMLAHKPQNYYADLATYRRKKQRGSKPEGPPDYTDRHPLNWLNT